MKYLLPVIILMLGVLSCVEEFDMETSDTINPVPGEIINTKVYGQVLDESDRTVEGAEVFLRTYDGSKSTTTDGKGYFEFPDARVAGSSAFLTVERSGKFEAFRRLSTIKNKWNYTQIKLLDKKKVGNINATSGGSVSTTEGAKLALPADAVVRQNGNTYNGSVNVAMQWIDPTAEDLQQRIVGDLSGIDNEGNRVALGTYGMMVVELQDETGNELQIADGKKAELTYPIPSEMQNNAPQTLPMWSYDEDRGRWIEETVASRKNGNYVTEVGHFSAWNVDWKGETIEILGMVTLDGDTSSNLTSFKIQVMSSVFGQRGGYLSPDGEFLFYNFPANEEFSLKIINICGETVHEQMYGPFSQNTDLGTIDISGGSDLDITGTAVDCDNDPIEDARVQIEYGHQKLYTRETDANGEFVVTAPYCGNPIDANATLYNSITGKTSQPQDFTVDGSNIMLGDIQVCDEPPEFFSFTIDNTDEYYYTDPPDEIHVGNLGLSETFIAYHSNEFAEQNHATIGKFDNPLNGTGTYKCNLYTFKLFNESPPKYYGHSGEKLTVEITEFSSSSGEHIKGNFNGLVIDSAMTNFFPIDGEFKVKVD